MISGTVQDPQFDLEAIETRRQLRKDQLLMDSEEVCFFLISYDSNEFFNRKSIYFRYPINFQSTRSDFLARQNGLWRARGPITIHHTVRKFGV